MMLDPNIALNPNRPEPTPFARTLGQMVALRGMRQDQQAQQQEMDERAQIQEIMRGDPATRLERLKAVNPGLAMSYEKAAVEGQIQQLKLAGEKATQWSRIAGGIKLGALDEKTGVYTPGDDASFLAGLTEAHALGLINDEQAQQFVAMAPGKERDDAVLAVRQSVLTEKEKVELRRQALEDARKAAAQPTLDAKAEEELAGVRLRNEALRNPRLPLQHVPLVSGGRTMLGAFNPATGQYQDQFGNPLPDARPIPPAAAQGGASGQTALYNATDPAAIAKAIIAGDLPPVISDYGRAVQGAVATALAKQGFDLSAARTD